jgi:hypothetical protein
VKIIVNGREHTWTNPKLSVGYDFLVRLAGQYPEHCPNAIYRRVNGIAKEIIRGQFAPIEDGIIFTVAQA